MTQTKRRIPGKELKWYEEGANYFLKGENDPRVLLFTHVYSELDPARPAGWPWGPGGLAPSP